MASLTASMASSRGITRLIAKKQVCRTVLVRLPMPAARATVPASIVHSSTPRSMIRCCRGRGRRANSSPGGNGALTSSTVPSRAYRSTSTRSRIDQWWHPMKPALFTR